METGCSTGTRMNSVRSVGAPARRQWELRHGTQREDAVAQPRLSAVTRDRDVRVGQSWGPLGATAYHTPSVLLGLTALGWLVLIPATACWPAAGVVVYFVVRSARRHDEQERQLAGEVRESASGASAKPSLQ